MARPRLIPTSIAFLCLMAGFAGPAWPGAMPAMDLERISEIAKQEGLPVTTIRQAGPKRLQVASEGELNREAFIKRASLLSYFIFERLKTPVDEIEFKNQGQACRIKASDYQLYLRDRISKVEYERRLNYRGAPPAQPPVAVPPAPAVQAPVVQPVALPTLAVPARPAAAPAPRGPLLGLTPLVGFSWGVGLHGGSYDAYQVEYGHPILRTMDLRPSLQILSPFSPLNFTGGAARPMQGLSVAFDMLGTSRQDVSSLGFSFDGGLGGRIATLQDASGASDIWPALHLRLGIRWHALSVGMRYPLFNRGNDPTAGWEATFGVSMPLDQI